MREKRKRNQKILLIACIAVLVGTLSFCAVCLSAALGKEQKSPVSEESAASMVPEESAGLSSSPEAAPEASEEAEAEALPDRFSAFYPQARDIIAQMTLSEKIGQMFLSDFPQTAQQQMMENYHPAGMILFAKQVAPHNAETLSRLLDRCRANEKIPPVFAVDEEGGEVVRISKYYAFRNRPFPSPQSLWKKGGLDALRADAEEKSRLLLDIGIGLNLAPVCDISENPKDYIYDRTLGLDAEQTAEGIRAIVETMEKSGISCALKHFPGYGGNPDTHTGTAHDTRSHTELAEKDFLPFQAGIEANAELVMFSHNVVSAIDPKLPASLSPEMHRILREELKFSGIAITDDLSMQAVDEFGDEAVLLAFEAGNNLIISHNLPQDYASLQKAVEEERITEEQLNEAILPTIAWKLEKGMFLED